MVAAGTDGRLPPPVAALGNRAMYVPLRVRSNTSLLYGASRPDELIDTARRLGYRAMALADRDTMYGAIPFYIAARQAGIEPILGVELFQGQAATEQSALLLARDLEGYRTLCRLVTARNLDESFDLGEALCRHHEGLFVVAMSIPLVNRLRGHVPADALFLGLCAYGDRRDRLRQEGTVRAARAARVPLAAAPEIAFHHPHRHRVHRVLRAIAERALAADLPMRRLAHPRAHLCPPADMAARYAPWPEALANARLIADGCRLELPLGRHVFPSFPLTEGETAYSRLARLAFDGLARRHGRLRPEAVARVEHELAIIERLGFSPYFLIVHDIAEFARREKIPTVARGSAANSLVVYALGLSNVDPLEHDLYFERFLNLSRSDCPDIDLDVCWRRRDKVIDYIFRTYGPAHVAMLSTHTTYQARSAFRDVARACGIAPAEADRLSKVLPHYGARSIRDAIVSFPECRSFPVDRPGMAEILTMTETLDGYPRHTSVHVGGVVIADRPLTDYVPLERAAKGVVVTQYDMDSVERMGLVKMDILAQRSLTIIEDTCRRVRENYGIEIDPESIPDGDAATAATLREGRTIGCFQIESPGMRNLLKMMRARNRLDVIHALSLIRPGPASSGMKERFIRRRLGQEPTEYADERLRGLLDETHGVMLYQEDVLRVAHVMAGFSLEKADELRKAMTKDRSGDRFDRMREEFLRGVLQGGGTRELAETLWDQVSQFAGYSYCKAHACTYGQISYQTVYLKSRRPGEFLAAVLANQAGYYEPREYVEEARRLGVTVLPPDINASDVEFAAHRCETATAGSAIRVGLRHVRGLSARHIRQLIDERQRRGPYRSLDDLLLRVPLARDEAENLILSGAMDGFGLSQPELLWRLDLEHKRLSRASPGGLFQTAEENETHTATTAGVMASCAPAEWQEAAAHGNYPVPDDYSPGRRLGLEEFALDLTASAHPMTVLGKKLDLPDRVPNGSLGAHVGRQVCVAGVLVASRRARTRSGEFMMFVSLEDETAVVECVLFPDVYQKCGHVLISRGPYVAWGTVENQHGAITLAVQRLTIADPATAPNT